MENIYLFALITIIGLIVLAVIFVTYKSLFKKLDNLDDLKAYQESLLKENELLQEQVHKINDVLDGLKIDIQKQINHTRLSNIIHFTTEIAKYRNGVYEDKYFIQEVGECKIFKIIDKKMNEITNIYYQDNLKSFTETFLANKLKHKMYYAEGLLVTAKDFDVNGNIVVSYEYDEAGEISSKTEYEYDNNGDLLNQTRKEYL